VANALPNRIRFFPLLFENPILRYEVLDSVLLSAIDPSRKDKEQEVPGVGSELSYFPGCAVKIRSIPDRHPPVKWPTRRHGVRVKPYRYNG
jgi:hypothetical protein